MSATTTEGKYATAAAAAPAQDGIQAAPAQQPDILPAEGGSYTRQPDGSLQPAPATPDSHPHQE